MSVQVKNTMQIMHDSWNYQRAKFWFWPIVICFTMFFGFFAGIQGAFVGFFYGLACGGFLLYESMPENKQVKQRP
ncbi:MAG: hypothetical protein LUQ36_08695 [Methanoregula sp.]|jgi:hypothetical protein|nr:hypothetical protein [Methanoregula sp.]